VQKLKKFEVLEEKIALTLKELDQLNNRCESLKRENSLLREELDDLREQKEKLTVGLETARSRGNSSLERKEIINRIDRMLEKFGELQI
jgi:regulator of replication initiation timing